MNQGGQRKNYPPYSYSGIITNEHRRIMNLTIEELSTKTVMALKAYAKKNKIELFDSTTKLEILEILASWTPPKNKEKETVEEISKAKSMDNKIALYSERNLHMENLGALKVGYNIVSKEASEKWLTHRLVRVASPEELAAYYGK